MRVTNDSPCLCSAPPRIIKRAWPSPKWSWPPPTSETRTAGASTSTRPSRTSGRPSTCGVHQRLGSGQTAYSNTARYNLIDEGGCGCSAGILTVLKSSTSVHGSKKHVFDEWQIHFFMVAYTAVERSALTGHSVSALPVFQSRSWHLVKKPAAKRQGRVSLLKSGIKSLTVPLPAWWRVFGKSCQISLTFFFFYYSVHTEIPFKMTNSIILWMT